MRLPNIILSAATALTAFAASVGLVGIVSYLSAPLAIPKLNVIRINFAPMVTNQPPVIKKEPMPEDKPYVHKEFSEPGEDGYYYIIGTPKLENNPKGFKDFRHFELSKYRLEEKTHNRIPVRPIGAVYTNISFDFARLEISGKKISFTTVTQNGVFYRLEGKLVDETITVKDSDGEDYSDTVAVKGILTKWKNGVKIAEAKVNFGYTIGC